MKKLLIFFHFLIIGTILSGQNNKEKGFPFLRNFPPSEYKAHAQNFSIVTDRKGLVYFGNFAGILQYDAESWRLIPTGETTRVSALATDRSGKIYVGGRGEIGLIDPAGSEVLAFQNLLSGRNMTYPPFTDILQVFAFRDQQFFIARNLIFTFDGQDISVWSSPDEITGGFLVDDVIYLQIRNLGLATFLDGRITGTLQTRMFGEAVEIKAMLPYSVGRILVATGTQGLYLLENGSLTEFVNPANEFLMNNLVTCGIRLSDGTFALGTARAGIVVIDNNGRIVQIIDRKASLRDNFVQSLYSSGKNTVWAALNNGISMIEIPSPMTFFDEKSGLSGAVNQVIRFDNNLYAATYQGLFYYEESNFEFLPVPGILSSCWSMVPYNDFLLAGTSQGVYMIKNKKATLVKPGFSLSLTCSVRDPLLVYSGETRGLYTLKQTGNQWNSKKIEGLEDDVRDLEPDNRGNLWGVSLSEGVFRFSEESQSLEFFGIKNGLPEKAGISINRIADKMSFCTRKGVFFFNDTTRNFDRIRLATGGLEDEWYSLIAETSEGDLWVNEGDETHIMKLVKLGGSYVPEKIPFLPIADLVVRNVYPDPKGIAWFGTPDGLIRYNSNIPNDNMEAAPALIRRIVANNDSVLFNGNGEPTANLNDKNKLVLDYKNNSLRFEFSSPFFAPKGKNQYRYYLEGFEDTWSDWTPQSNKEYTNILAGKYVFHVQSGNVYNNSGAETSVDFQILRPWYSSIWAYLLYFLILAGIVYLIVIFRNRNLIREKQILEQRIAERTTEVVRQKEEIESQSQELANKNDELEKINSVVKSINAEVNFENLLQSLIDKLRVVRSIDKSVALVFDKNANNYKFKAGFGWPLQQVENISLSLADAENRYLKNAEEVFEDIFIKTEFSTLDEVPVLRDLAKPRTLMTLVVRIENRVEAFLLFQNMSKVNAFEPKDLSFFRNAKEHIISAFIRTRILEDLQNTLQNLKETQDQLVQSEKLASLGELTAGIAHEIQNPLNFVNNFSSLSAELTTELLEVLNDISGTLPDDKSADLEELVTMIQNNVKKINEHGKRAESIVKGMLQHSRGKTGEFELVDINNMVAEYVNLAYHGMRAKDKSFNTAIRTQLDPGVGKASIIPQDLSRVVLNIVNNACYALNEKTRKNIPGFSPEVVVSTRKIDHFIEIRIRDNGTGIPDHIREKIFNPFFTTKPTGKGTGLGLSVSFDIVNKIHKGKLEVHSKEGEFTEFIITIPETQS
jgi:signal transduction histidine kinase/ligand-binding sensor domain-containing protein